MKKLTVDFLKSRRSQLDRRSFLRSIPLITAFLLASQATPLYGQSGNGTIEPF